MHATSGQESPVFRWCYRNNVVAHDSHGFAVATRLLRPEIRTSYCPTCLWRINTETGLIAHGLQP